MPMDTTKTTPLVRAPERRVALPRLAWELVKRGIKAPFYALYERRLARAARFWTKPQHIGVVMDGNRRFARTAGFAKASAGHARGAEKLIEVLDWCFDFNIPVVTVWCFSLENFERVQSEVDELLQLFETKTREMAEDERVHANRVRVRYIGRLDLLPESLRQAIRDIEASTAHYADFVLNIAMAYGGRQEIADAFRCYLADQRDTGASLEGALEQFDESVIERYLYTSGLPEPDLILRTSGEVRLSGFLLWQSAYSEYYFCDSHWPAFRRIDFLRALRAYNERQRRFGR